MYKNLIKIRKSKKISGITLSKVIGVSKSTYYKKEQGLVRFTVEEARIISNYLRTSVDEIFFKNKVSKNETNLKIS